MKRGEVWLTRFDPTIGSEIQKTRPALIVSPDDFSHLPTVIVAPLTSASRPARFRVPVTFQGRTGLILVDQIRTLDRQRFVRRIGVIEPETLAQTLAKLREAFED